MISSVRVILISSDPQWRVGLLRLRPEPIRVVRVVWNVEEVARVAFHGSVCDVLSYWESSSLFVSFRLIEFYAHWSSRDRPGPVL